MPSSSLIIGKGLSSGIKKQKIMQFLKVHPKKSKRTRRKKNMKKRLNMLRRGRFKRRLLWILIQKVLTKKIKFSWISSQCTVKTSSTIKRLR